MSLLTFPARFFWLAAAISIAGPLQASEAVIPHIADGGGWKTTIVLTNAGSEAAPVTLSFRRTTSQGLTETWNLAFQEGTATTHSLPSGGTLFLHTTGAEAQTSVGWANIQTAGQIEAYVIFTSSDKQEATAPAMSATKRVLIPFDNTSGFVTSMALVNPTNTAQPVSVGIRTAGGLVTTTTLSDLPAGGHTAFAIPDRIAATVGQQGLLEFSGSSGVLAGIGLRFNPAGAFTSVPAYHRAGDAIITGPRISALNLTAASVQPGSSIAGTVTLSGPAPSGGATITLQSSSAAVGVPATVVVPAGSTTASFNIPVGAGSASQQVTITALYGGAAVQSTLSVVAIQLNLSRLTLAANTLGQGGTVLGTVQMSGPAPAGGAVVSLQSSSPAAIVPATVVVPAGSSTATFPITGGTVGTTQYASISAQYGGASVYADLSITSAALNITGLTLSASTLGNGGAVTATVQMSGPAPAGGAVVALQSTSPAVIVPATVIVPAGSSSATFTITGGQTDWTANVTIYAVYGSGQAISQVMILPAQIRLGSFELDYGDVYSDTTVAGRVYLNGPAPAGGALITFSMDTPAVTIPGPVLIPEGSLRVDVSVVIGDVRKLSSIAIVAEYQGARSYVKVNVASLTPNLKAIYLDTAPVDSGSTRSGSLQLHQRAPVGGGGFVIPITASSSAVTIPATVTIQAGADSGSFQIAVGTVSSPTQVTISAQAGGETVQATLQILPPGAKLYRLSLPRQTVHSGGSLQTEVMLDRPAPPSGAVIRLSADPSVTVPSTVTIPAESRSTHFAATAGDVLSLQKATITADYAGLTLTTSLGIVPTSSNIQGLVVYAKSIRSGTSASAYVLLDGPAPEGGATITLSATSPALQTPSTVVVPSGTAKATFQISCTNLSAVQPVTLSAFFGSSTAQVHLNAGAQDLELGTFTLPSNTIKAGQRLWGYVALNGPAPPGGAQITVASSSPALTVSEIVNIPAGAQRTGVFYIASSSVTTTQTATITVTYAGKAIQQSVELSPLQQGMEIPNFHVGGEFRFEPTGLLTGQASLSCAHELDPTVMSCQLFFGYNLTPLSFILRLRVVSPDGGRTFVSDGWTNNSSEYFSISYLGVPMGHQITSLDLRFTRDPSGGTGPDVGRLTGSLRITGRHEPVSPEVILATTFSTEP